MRKTLAACAALLLCSLSALPIGADAPYPADPVPLDPELSAMAAPWATAEQLGHVAARRNSGAATEADRPVRFIVLGDVEPGRFFWSRWLFNDRGVFQSMLARLKGQEADFVLQLGDMVSRGTPRMYRRFFRTLNAAGLPQPYLTAIGNHDRRWPRGEVDADIYRAAFGPLDYHFDAGDRRFVVLDTSLNRLSAAQLDWLDSTLDTTRRGLVFCHIPPRQLRPWTFGGAGFEEGSERFLDILARRRVERVYVAHVHGFGSMELRGVRFVLSGGGGSPLYPSGAPRKLHHYLVVEARPDGLSETVHPLHGQPFPVLWQRGAGVAGR